jgi:hypothetical protein
MVFTEAFLSVVETFAAASELELRTVSSRVFDDGKVLPGLKAGMRTISFARAETAMLWFSEHWPDDVPWPAGVPRPELTAGANNPISAPERAA